MEKTLSQLSVGEIVTEIYMAGRHDDPQQAGRCEAELKMRLGLGIVHQQSVIEESEYRKQRRIEIATHLLAGILAAPMEFKSVTRYDGDDRIPARARLALAHADALILEADRV